MDVITFPVNLYTTSGLSILLHGVILLSDATSYDKIEKSGSYKCKTHFLCSSQLSIIFVLVIN